MIWFSTIRALRTYLLIQSLLVISLYAIWSDGKTIHSRHKNITCRSSEREALLTFKDEISEDLYGLMTSWGNRQHGNPDCCTWNGVTCSRHSGHVIRLILNGSLVPCLDCRVIGSSLGELKNLMYLDLSYNYFNGMVIPTSIGTLINLRELHLQGSRFSGEVPNQLGNLTRLTSLDLRFNDGLYVESLNWLSRLTLLKGVYLSGTDLSKAKDWSRVVGSLRRLEVLYMDGCVLSLPVPSWSLQSPNLNTISLSGNRFTSSSVFQWLFNSTHSAKVLGRSMNYLDLSSNSLQGPIPNTIGNLVSLTYLNLSSNSLQGPIPNIIGNLVSLTYLNLSHNSLSNNLPRTIKNLKFLLHLGLSNNSLTVSNTLRDTFGQLARLTCLDLSRNLISDTLHDDTFGQFEGLRYLNLSRNLISGTLHDIFGQFESLEYLDLSHNLISGTLPDPLGYVELFEYLDLSHNKLSGTMPRTIGHASNLAHLSLSHNALEGIIPTSIINLNSLAYLDLSYNLLEGPINDTVTYLYFLTYLDLSHNSLSGTIPDTIGNLYSLTYLDLSFNLLSGTIPESIFWHIKSLVFLDFSHNPLTTVAGNVEVNDKTKSDDKIKIGLYVSIGLGIYTGFFVFWATLAMKDQWRWSYFEFLDHMIKKFFVRVAPYIAGYRREA